MYGLTMGWGLQNDGLSCGLLGDMAKTMVPLRIERRSSNHAQQHGCRCAINGRCAGRYPHMQGTCLRDRLDDNVYSRLYIDCLSRSAAVYCVVIGICCATKGRGLVLNANRT